MMFLVFVDIKHAQTIHLTIIIYYLQVRRKKTLQSIWEFPPPLALLSGAHQLSRKIGSLDRLQAHTGQGNSNGKLDPWEASNKKCKQRQPAGWLGPQTTMVVKSW